MEPSDCPTDGLAGDQDRGRLLATLSDRNAHYLDRGAAGRAVLKLTGQTAGQIAKLAGISPGNLSKLTTTEMLLPESQRKCARDGTLGFAQAYDVARDQAAAARTTRKTAGPRRHSSRRLELGSGVTLMIASGSPTPLTAVIHSTVNLLHRLNDAHARGIDTLAAFATPAP